MSRHVFNSVVLQGLGCRLLPPLGAPAHTGAGAGGTSQVDLQMSFTNTNRVPCPPCFFAPGVFNVATSWQASCDGPAYTNKGTTRNRFPDEGRDRVPLCCARWRGLDSSLDVFSGRLRSLCSGIRMLAPSIQGDTRTLVLIHEQT